jgi:hypothetical protein
VSYPRTYKWIIDFVNAHTKVDAAEAKEAEPKKSLSVLLTILTGGYSTFNKGNQIFKTLTDLRR